MNGIHDMGGMHGFGPVPREEQEPVFHAPWEGRVFAMTLALGSRGVHDPLGLRFSLEEMDPALYLSSSFYERWLNVAEQALLGKGLLTREELEARMEHLRQHSGAEMPRREAPAAREHLMGVVHNRRPPQRDVGIVPRYKVGDSVEARTVHTRGHTLYPATRWTPL